MLPSGMSAKLTLHEFAPKPDCAVTVAVASVPVAAVLVAVGTPASLVPVAVFVAVALEVAVFVAVAGTGEPPVPQAGASKVTRSPAVAGLKMLQRYSVQRAP